MRPMDMFALLATIAVVSILAVGHFDDRLDRVERLIKADTQQTECKDE